MIAVRMALWTVVTGVLGSGLAVGVMPSAWAQKELKTCNNMDAQLKSQTLTFALTHSQVPGRLAVTTHELKISAGQYKLDAVSEAKGLLALMHAGQLTQHSEGTVSSKMGLEPLFYSEKRGKKPAKEVAVDLNAKQVTFRKNGEKAPYVAGLQDRLSLAYQLAAIAGCAGQETNTGQLVRLPVSSTGKIDTEVFTAEAWEELSLDLGGKTGPMKALRWANKPKDKEDDVIRVWLSPELAWTPVQIQVEDPKGTSMTQSLLSISRGK